MSKQRFIWVGNIDEALYLDFSTKLHTLEKQKAKYAELEIFSEGGDGDTGLALHGRISVSKVIFTGIGHGLVHSAALGAYAACRVRVCTPECTFRIHNAEYKAKGDYRNIKKVSNRMIREEDHWAEILEKCTGTHASVWRELSDDDAYLTAKQAFEYGLVNKIIGERK